MKLSLLAAVALCGADGGVTLYSAATSEPHGLVQLELAEAAGTGHFRQVISIHLPPAEIENVDVKVTAKGDTLCLDPKPRAIEACVVKKGDKLEATLRDKKTKVLLERR